MDNQYVAFLTLLLTWYVVPILVTFFTSFMCREMGIPVWCPWVALAAYIHQSQATVIHSINRTPPGEDEGG